MAGMWSRHRPIAPVVLAASLAACSGYSPKSEFTPPSLSNFGTSAGIFSPGYGKATVLVSSGIAGLTCAESRIVLAQAEGDGFKTVRIEKVANLFGAGASAAVIDLDPGTYHIVEFACRNGANVVYAGTNPSKDAVPWQADHWTHSLASFALVSGDVMDAGELLLTPIKVVGFASGIDGRKANLSVGPSPQTALAEIVRVRPELAPGLHSAVMHLAGATEIVLAKCRLVAPQKAVPADGTSKLPEVLAAHPEAAPVVKSIGTATTDADSCVSEGGSGFPLTSSAITKLGTSP